MQDTENADGIKRQAVVIIHGIGEQRPMDTLRGFVNALLHQENAENQDKDQPYYSKPDTISDSYELRRIKLKKFTDRGVNINDDWYETDFFEYYWAHHMSGTEWWHVFSWIYRIIHRSFSDVKEKDSENTKHKAYENQRNHKRLGLLYTLTWAFIIVLYILVAIVAVVIAKVVIFIWSLPVVATIGVLIGVPAFVLALIAFFKFHSPLSLLMVKNTIGDAARYLDVAPTNIARRYDILRGGKDMLRNLHKQTSEYTEKGKVRYVYDRIVIIGHSLGSIIAYDLLKHYWLEVNGHLPIEDRETLKEEDRKTLEELESFYCTEDCPGIAQTRKRFWRAQYNLWRYLNRTWLGKEEFDSANAPRARWLITDFITLGSPLSYGTLLLADNVDDFKTRTKLRELPVCPPDRSRLIRPGQFVVPLDQEADVSPTKKYDILHHSGLFAVTRWTNFYFPKDPIAGSIKNVFGAGIRDIELIEGPNSWGTSHTSYWDLKSTTCLDKLRVILKNAHCSG